MAADWFATINIHNRIYSQATEKLELETDYNINGKIKGSITISNIEYTCTINSLYLHKAIYSPNKIDLSIDVNKSDTSALVSQWSSDGRISIVITEVDTSIIPNKVKKTIIVENYPIFNITSSYTQGKSGSIVNFTAYSPDKLLTLDKYCRAYTNRSIGRDIIKNEFTGDDGFESILDKYGVKHLDFDSFACAKDETDEEYAERLKNDSKAVRRHKTSFVHLTPIGTEKADTKLSMEPAMPYLVQYNESFYDFMRRTLYRCGEYMFFDDNSMHFGIGSSKDTTVVFSADKIECNTIVPYSNRYSSICNYNYGNKNIDERGNYQSSISQNSELQQLAMMTSNFEELTKTDFWLRDVGFDPMTCYSMLVTRINGLITSDSWTKYLGEEISNIAKSALDYIPYVESPSIQTKLKNEETKKKVYDKISELYQDLLESHPLTKDGGLFYVNQQKAIEEVNNQSITLEQSSVYNKVSLGNVIKGKGIVNEIIIDYKFETSVSFSQRVKVVPIKVIKGTTDNNINFYYPAKYNIPLTLKSGPQHAFVVGQFNQENEYPDVKTGTSADPDNLHRVTVRYPWQREEDDISPLIRMALPMATKYGGFSFIPREGDEAIINYDYGNIELPYIEGMVNNMANWSYTNLEHGYNTAITSPNGHTISFDDPAKNKLLYDFVCDCFPFMKTAPWSGIYNYFGKPISDWLKKVGATVGGETFFRSGGMSLSDMNGIYNISMSSDKRAIDIESPLGTVSINALTGISIEAPVGDVSICGRNVSIVANNNLSISSGAGMRDSTGTISRSLGWGRAVKDGATDVLNAAITDPLMNIVNLKNVINIGSIRYLVDLVMAPCEGTLSISSPRYITVQQGQGKIDFGKIYYSQKEDKHHLLAKADLWMATLPSIVKNICMYIGAAKNSINSIDDIINTKIQYELENAADGFDADVFQEERNQISEFIQNFGKSDSSTIKKLEKIISDCDSTRKKHNYVNDPNSDLLGYARTLLTDIKNYDQSIQSGKLKNKLISAIKKRDTSISADVKTMVNYVFDSLGISETDFQNLASVRQYSLENRLSDELKSNILTRAHEEIEKALKKTGIATDKDAEGHNWDANVSWDQKVNCWVKKYEDSLKKEPGWVKENLIEKGKKFFKDDKGLYMQGKNIAKAVMNKNAQTTFADSAFDKFHKPRILISTEKGKVHFVEDGELREYTMNYSRYFTRVKDVMTCRMNFD